MGFTLEKVEQVRDSNGELNGENVFSQKKKNFIYLNDYLKIQTKYSLFPSRLFFWQHKAKMVAIIITEVDTKIIEPGNAISHSLSTYPFSFWH